MSALEKAEKELAAAAKEQLREPTEEHKQHFEKLKAKVDRLERKLEDARFPCPGCGRALPVHSCVSSETPVCPWCATPLRPKVKR